MDDARHVGGSTEFWLVSARVGTEDISGLDTVLSGAHIAADFNAEPGEARTSFAALAKPPLTALGKDGLRVSIRAPEGGSVALGAPVLFKRIAVGQVEDVGLTERGDVLITAFIDAPADARVTSTTRFCNTSGFRVELSAASAALNDESLAAPVQGVIAFDTFTSGGEPVGPATEFRLFQSEGEARVVVLNDDSAARVNVIANFSGSVRGLAIGAPVEYRGIQVGEVAELQAEVIRVDDSPVVTVRATLGLNPSRFGLPQGEDAHDRAMELIAAAIGRGVRARLASGNILTGSLYVELADIRRGTRLHRNGGASLPGGADRGDDRRRSVALGGRRAHAHREPALRGDDGRDHHAHLQRQPPDHRRGDPPPPPRISAFFSRICASSSPTAASRRSPPRSPRSSPPEYHLLPPPASVTSAPAPVASLVVADISLPSYAEVLEIAVLTGTGAVTIEDDALWADTPRRALTRHLVAALQQRLTGRIGGEPWSGFDGPALRVEVVVDRMIGAPAGPLDFAGQYIITAPGSGRITDSDRFAIRVPPQGDGYDALLAAHVATIDALADRIAASVTGRPAS